MDDVTIFSTMLAYDIFFLGSHGMPWFHVQLPEGMIHPLW